MKGKCCQGGKESIQVQWQEAVGVINFEDGGTGSAWLVCSMTCIISSSLKTDHLVNLRPWGVNF